MAMWLTISILLFVTAIYLSKRRNHDTRSPTGSDSGDGVRPDAPISPKAGSWKSIIDPREAATVLMLCVARAGNGVENVHLGLIHSQIMRRFDLDEDMADALLDYAVQVMETIHDPFTPVALLSRRIHESVGHKELIELEDMLHVVAHAGGEPGMAQKALCDEVALKVGV